MNNETSNFIEDLLLDSEKEAVASEMAALQSIYGEESLETWPESPNYNDPHSIKAIRYQITVR